MNPQMTRGLYVTVGAALGAVAVRAFVGRRLHSREAVLAERFDEPDVPRSVREALTASARAHRLSRPVPDDMARQIADRAEGRRAISGEQRQEVSSLVAPNALAPDPQTIGEELVDPGAIEVPLGHSADPDIDPLLSHAKLPQPDSTGAALQRFDAGSGVHEAESPVYDDEDTRTDLTARPARDPVRAADDAYDAIAPDDLGSEWLTRATEASSMDATLDTSEKQPPELLFESGMSVVSEGSLNAANAEQIESNASANLDDDDYVPEDIDDLRDKENR